MGKKNASDSAQLLQSHATSIKKLPILTIVWTRPKDGYKMGKNYKHYDDREDTFQLYLI